MGLELLGNVVVAGGAFGGIVAGFLMTERARRRHAVEDILSAAEGAVAAAKASQQYIQEVPVEGLTDEAKQELNLEFAVHNATFARDALEDARRKITMALPYLPDLKKYVESHPAEVLTDYEKIMAQLHAARLALSDRRLRKP
jgi:hypothetical protein